MIAAATMHYFGKFSVFTLILASLFATGSSSGSSFEIGEASRVAEGKKPIMIINPALLARGNPKNDKTLSIGDNTHFSLDILVGNETALRMGVQVAALNDSSFLSVEALGGGSIGVAGFTPIVGGGLRVHLNLAESANGRNALFVSPAVDVLVAWDPSPSDPGMIDLGPDSNVYLLAPNVDISWVHELSRNFSFTLGAHLGAQISLGGLNNRGVETRGLISPEVAFFVGVRF